MSPETLDRFRKKFHKTYFENAEAEGLAQAGCTMVGAVEELETALEASREAVAKLAGIRVNMQSSIDRLSDQLTDSEAEVARLTGERDEARRLASEALELILSVDFPSKMSQEEADHRTQLESELIEATRSWLAAPPGEPAR